MLVAAAVCPHPPLLVPEVAGAAAPELASVRAACGEAVRRVLASRPELIVIVGAGPRTVSYGRDAAGSLAGYGVAVRVGDSAAGEPVLPPSLTVGRWLLEEFRPPGVEGIEVLPYGIDAGAGPQDCLRLGTTLAGRAGRVGMLAMGDGSARRSTTAPGQVDERAYDFDASVAGALAEGDAHALARLDAGLADELAVAGRPAWQVLAGAAGETRFRAELLADAAPYGMAYLVAVWLAAGPPSSPWP
ncbi:MAG: hypothetical protein GEV03_15115 [Streptosporangiales bacterium]|nr:hypothetical protein [Streptosporangiales bacterium]